MLFEMGLKVGYVMTAHASPGARVRKRRLVSERESDNFFSSCILDFLLLACHTKETLQGKEDGHFIGDFMSREGQKDKQTRVLPASQPSASWLA